MPFWIAPALLGAAALQQKPPAQLPLPPEEDAPPAAQTKPSTPTSAPAPKSEQGAKPSDADLPPDEDAALNTAEKHSFNPVESKKSVATGEFYFKKGNYRAAAERFRDATQWNQGNADAWLHLGEAEEKRDQVKDAREAYQKYLQLAGNTKAAAEVKKKLEKLK